MTGLIIAGSRVPVAGVEVVTWLDDPTRAPPVTDGLRRDAGRVQAICIHTSRGVRGAVLREGARASTRAEQLARYQATTAREVSWHLTIDSDGTVIQQADLATWTAWHAGHANGWTIGVELVQHPDSPDLWRVQLAALVAVCEAIVGAIPTIQRRVIVDASGAPLLRPVPALLSEAARDSAGRPLGGRARRWAGAIGHCQVVPDHVRGPGDPGALPLLALLDAGWVGVPVEAV